MCPFSHQYLEIRSFSCRRLAQEREYSRLIDTANAPIFGIDVNGDVNEWNIKATDITHYTKQDVFGKDLVDCFITDEYKHAVKRVFDEALQGREAQNFEFPLFTKDGNRVEVLLNDEVLQTRNFTVE